MFLKKHKFQSLAIGLSWLLVGGLTSCSKSPGPTKIHSKGEQEKIRVLIDKIYESAALKQLDLLDSFHSFGPKFSKFGAGHISRIMNAEQARKQEREHFEKAENFKFQFTDLKVDVFDSSAVATFIITFDYDINQKKVTGTNRGTLVFIKEKSEWKITHEHFSTFNPGAHDADFKRE